MKISGLCIRRPVFATMMIGALLVLGAFSYAKLSVDLFPEIDFPFVVVQTIYPGASAEAVETEVTEKIEEVANQISGVRHIVGRSREGYSLIFVEFELEVDGTVASQDVREKVAGIRSELPTDIEEPIIGQFDPSAQAVFSLAISGKRSAREITYLIKEKIKPRLEPIPGVGQVELIGGSEREIRVALNPDKMEAYAVTIDDVTRSIASANLEIPGGRVEESSREYLVRLMGKLTHVAQFDSIIVKNENGTPVYLNNIARVIDAVAEQRSLSRYNGDVSIGLNIIKQSGANIVRMAEKMREVLDELRAELPPDIKIETVDDNSVWIEESIEEILLNMKIGTLLAVLVIFLFLLDIRPTLITALSIPISIIATFSLLNFLGFTINMMTLLGLSLAVGILVDDAIVVIENIYRHLDEGESAMQAALSGTKEIGLAVVAASSAIMVVFLPVAFMEGIIGRFFYQFGMTVAFAVATSLFVAFTLTPMLSSRMFGNRESDKIGSGNPSSFPGRLWERVRSVLSYWNIAFDAIKPIYKRTLAYSLGHRTLVIAIAVVSFAFAIFIAILVGTEFMPESDQGKLVVDIRTSPGTDLDKTTAKFS
ncbi:MAG: efflux RND transporter permease subunit, partial [candidate division Zixibacteria bacterium]|nr:efflux RND transporter permease subunit [candidate division Zixibacteria bacterium]